MMISHSLGISNAGAGVNNKGVMCMWVGLFYFTCQPKVAKLTKVKEMYGSVR
jgi:hypothetical protein